MSNYPLASCIAFILFGMGLIAFSFGERNYRENKSSKIGRQMYLVCVCVFLWDFGYAWMSMCYGSDFAYIPRAVALLGVYLYMLFILRYVAAITEFPRKKLIIMLSIFAFMAVISWPQIIQKSAVTFTVTPWGYWYYSKMSAGRLIQFASVLVGLAEYYVILRYGRKKARTKREQYVYKQFGLFGPILFTGYAFDTLIPSIFKTPAIPGSGIAAFFAALILYNIARTNRMLDLSKENVSNYVFDDVNVPVIVTDTEGKIVLYNNCTADFVGMSGRDLARRGIDELFDKYEDGTVKVKDQEKECQIDKTDILDNFEEKLYSIYFVRDITEERNSFRLMKKSKEEAEEANRAKSDFLANMSHEIRTPMNAIIGMSEIVLDNGELPEDVVKQVNEIKIAGTNLLSIINDILDMSKIEAGKYELINDSYEVPELIQEISSVVSARLRHSEVYFELDIDKTLPKTLIGDAGRIRQILMNIIGNAIKFTKEGSIVLKVTWNHFEQAPDLLIDIADTGIGIKPEDIDKIFGKYDQVDTKKNRSVQGTGLGLAISRDLAVMMGGMITVESVYGEGSTFHIVICQNIKEYEAIGEDTALKLQQKSYVIPVKTEIKATAKSDTKVLVVDDSKVNLMVATGLMKKYDMKVDTAMSGAESIEMVKKTDYDIVFMDHMMPEMDGVEAMKAIRELGEKYKDLPIVALTANALSESKNTLLNEGFQDFLAKPINLSELDRVIKQWS